MILCLIFLLILFCSLSHKPSSCDTQKKRAGARLQPQAPRSCPGRIWHLGHVPFPLTLFIQGTQNVPGTTSSSTCSQVLFSSALPVSRALGLCRTDGLCTSVTHAAYAAQICCSWVGTAQLHQLRALHPRMNKRLVFPVFPGF